MNRSCAALALLPLTLVLRTDVAAGVLVHTHDGLVDVQAAAPFADVLDELARSTGVRVAYVGPRPSSRIVVELAARPPAAAIRQVLDGLEPGYGYAVGLTPDRARVAVVVITESKTVATRARDPFEPPPGHGEALEPVPQPWELEARREAARLSPSPRVPSAAVVADAVPDPPAESYGPDPFEPPPERGNRLEPVAARR
jgi:hypothetical protein